MPALDGLRGFAILLVLLFHSTVVVQTSTFGRLMNALARGLGWSGVDLFFVLSGFLITGLLIDAKGAPHYFRNFYARRVLRIFPVYYGFLFAALVLLPRLAPDAAALVTVGDDGIWYWLYLQNFATAHAGEWVHSMFLNLFWSLAIEEQFYLAWPLVVLACGRRTLAAVCGALIVGSLLLRVALVAADVAPIAIYVLTPTRLDGFAVGGWLALRARAPAGLAPLSRSARWVALLSAGGICGVAWWQRGFDFRLPLTATAGYTLLALLFGALLVLALTLPERNALPRILRSRVLRSFGRYSYALYVVHQPVVFVATFFLAERLLPGALAGRGALVAQLVLYALAIGGAYALAFASWHGYESPFLRLKRFFPR